MYYIFTADQSFEKISCHKNLRLYSIIRYNTIVYLVLWHKFVFFSVQFDGKKVVSGAYDYLVKVWDPLEGTCLHTLQGHTNRVYSLQVW